MKTSFKNILSVDTCSEACSAALFVSGQCIDAKYLHAPREQADILPQQTKSLLAQISLDESLDLLVATHGPGSFSGVRIGVTFTQPLSLIAKAPMLGISALDLIAQEALEKHCLKAGDHISVALDARMNGVYHARYLVEDTENSLALKVLVPDTLTNVPDYTNTLQDSSDHFAGNAFSAISALQAVYGASHQADLIEYPNSRFAWPVIQANLSKIVPPGGLQPLYLRTPIFKKI